MNKILVTGGLGFIGTNLISELLKENNRILNLNKMLDLTGVLKGEKNEI